MVKRLGVLTLPYLFNDIEQVKAGVEGESGELLNSYAKDAGLRILAWTFSGFRYITNSKHPITKLEDIRGLRFRVPQSIAMIETYRAFGAIPSTLAWNMTSKALEHDLVDGQCCDYASFKGMKFFEAGQKYLTEIHYTFQPSSSSPWCSASASTPRCRPNSRRSWWTPASTRRKSPSSIIPPCPRSPSASWWPRACGSSS